MTDTNIVALRIVFGRWSEDGNFLASKASPIAKELGTSCFPTPEGDRPDLEACVEVESQSEDGRPAPTRRVRLVPDPYTCTPIFTLVTDEEDWRKSGRAAGPLRAMSDHP